MCQGLFYMLERENNEQNVENCSQEAYIPSIPQKERWDLDTSK